MINRSLGDDGISSYEDNCSFTCDIGYELTGSESRIWLSYAYIIGIPIKRFIKL